MGERTRHLRSRSDSSVMLAQIGTHALKRTIGVVLLSAGWSLSCGGETSEDTAPLKGVDDAGSRDTPDAERTPVRPEWLEPDVDTTPVACETEVTETRSVAVTCAGGCAAFDPPPRTDFVNGECAHASDCLEGVNGTCSIPSWSESICVYDQCFSDEDCAADEVCACGDGGWYSHNTCLRASCKTTDDCEPGQVCTLMAMPSLSACDVERQFHCTSDADECANWDDCPPAEDSGLWMSCAFDPAAGHRACRAAEVCPL